MKKIILTNGGFSLVDDADYPVLNRYLWYWIQVPNSDLRYAVRNATSSENENRGSIRMHRQLLGLPPKNPHVDHKDRNGLNNRRNNLRICAPGRNAQNRKIRKDSCSGFKGVHLRTSGSWKAWRAKIQIDGKNVTLGHYVTAKEAAKAYNRAARKHFGEFARLNIFIPTAREGEK